MENRVPVFDCIDVSPPSLPDEPATTSKPMCYYSCIFKILQQQHTAEPMATMHDTTIFQNSVERENVYKS